MKKIVLLLLVFLVVNCSKKREQKDKSDRISVDEIIKANTLALGGIEKLDKINSIMIISTKSESKYYDSIRFIVDRKGRMRIDIYDLKSDKKERVFSESYDGEMGYQWSLKNGQEPASEKGTLALRNTPQYPGHIFQLKDMRPLGHKLKLDGIERINNKKYFVLELTLSYGFKNYYYIDSETNLISKTRSTRALHVDQNPDEQLIEVEYLDYKKFNSILKPLRIVETDITKDTILTESIILKYYFNPQLDSNIYKDLTILF